MQMRIKLIAILLLIQCWTYAQKIENVTFTSDGESVFIDYFLKGEFAEQTFDVVAYSSFDGFKNPLKQVTGEVNRADIQAGKKKITWDAKKELTLYEGPLSIKIVAKVVSNYWIKTAFSGATLKRGKEYEIEWGGFKPETPVNIYLQYPDNKKVEIGTYQTGKSFMWKVDRGTKVSEGCLIKISDANNTDAIAKSDKFTVKRSVPLLATLGTGALIAGGIIYYVTLPETLEELPLPPSPAESK